MSIATEISRIQTNKTKIRAKLVELGMATNTDNLDVLAAAIEGVINQGAVSVEILEGTTYTIPAGYHNGSGTVKALTDATGEAELYKTQAKTATPTKKQQSITPDSGYYALSSVTVAPIPDAYQDVTSVTAGAADVLAGKIIVTADGAIITGAMVNNGTVAKTLDATTISYTIPKGYHSGTGTVKISLETKTVTPTKAAQDITPTNGKVLSKVTVNPIPDKYQDVTGVTTTAEKVLEGSTFVDAEGNVVEGAMYDWAAHDPGSGDSTAWNDMVGSQMLTPGRTRYEVPEGYHRANFTEVSVPYTNKTVTPTKQEQTVMGYFADDPGEGRMFLDSVTVTPIPDEYQDITGVTATAGDVLAGKKIIGSDGEEVTGSMPNKGAVTASLNTSATSYTVPAGYHNGSGKVSITTETKSATPTKSAQTITPTSGKVLSSVSVAAIPAAYQDVTGVTAAAATVLDGSVFVDKTGAVIEGTMANNGSASKTFDGLATTSVTIPAGYTTGGTISLTSDIEEALAAI